MRLALVIFLCFSLRCFGAAGDVAWATVQTNGWTLSFVVLAINTNGAFVNNLGPINGGLSKINLSVNSLGYNDTGGAIVVPRNLIGTKQLRLPYPNNALKDVQGWSETLHTYSPIGPDAIVTVALDEYIFNTCSNITGSVAASFYSNNNASGTISMTNLSTLVNPKCIANWSYPGWQNITNNTMELRAVGYHRSGQSGRPLRAMRFTAQDQSGNSNVVWVNAMTIVNTVGDALPVCEYVATMDVSTFTQGNQIRCDFAAFPWIGDTNAVLDTQDNVNSQPTPLYASITNLCNRTGTYMSSIAVVDPVSGSDVNGRASTNQDPTTINSSLYFATISKAANQIAASNNATYTGRISHNNGDTSVIYHLGTASTTFAGGASTYGTGVTNKSWLTIMPYPGVARSAAIIGNNLNDRALGNNKVRLYNLTITNASALTFLDIPYLWVDRNLLNHQTGTTFDGTEYEYFTGNLVSNIVGGFSFISGQIKVPIIVRGNAIQNSNLNGGGGVAIFCYTVLGNLLDYRNIASGWGTTVFNTDIAGQPIPKSTGAIIAYNKVLGLNSAVPQINLGAVSNNTHGIAIIQNIFEKTASSSAAPLMNIAANGVGTFISPYNNVMFWYNTAEGERLNWAYDANGTNIQQRYYWSLRKANTTASYNIKTDDYASFDIGTNRQGTWPNVWGVGYFGNNITAVTNFASSGAFLNEFPGLMTTFTNQVSTVILQPTDYPQYVANGAYNGVATNAGNGNYKLKSSSPLVFPLGEWYGLPYDIEGNARGNFDPPGAYSSSPRKGAGFF